MKKTLQLLMIALAVGAGAALNIVLDPLLIFGAWGLPVMGIAGAAIATVCGQVLVALTVLRKGYRKSPPLRAYPVYVRKILALGVPNMLMQSAYTCYILGLNLIPSSFPDQAVTAPELYYKWESFSFIPLGAMQTCIVPVVSYNYAAKSLARCIDKRRGAVHNAFILLRRQSTAGHREDAR